MEDKIYNWGILGLGKIARKFAADLAAVPNAKLFGVASRSSEKAEEFAAEFNAEKSFGSYEELVKNDEVDVVYIATPHVFHHDHTLLCLRHRKAVLCEKPFAMNKIQVMEMIKVAREQNVFLMEALWTYFLPHYKKVMQLIDSGKYGNITALEADFGFESPYQPEKRLLNKKLGGGSLLDIGIYPVFAALSLLGRPSEIIAKAEMGSTGVDESCDIQLKYPNHVTAILKSDITKKTPTTATIFLEKGKIIIEGRFHEPSSFTVITDENKEKFEFEVNTYGYNFEAIHVQKMLEQQRTESTVMSFQKSLELIEILDRIRKKIGLEY